MVIDYKEIGRRMAARRKELSLKQYQVCEMIDVNYKYLSNLETGRSAPSSTRWRGPPGRPGRR